MTDTVSIPSDVAEAFTDAWCNTAITSDVAASLGCTEADALADLLRALGAEQGAEEWIDAHAQDDEPNNRHFQGTVPAGASLAADGMHWSPAPADTQDESLQPAHEKGVHVTHTPQPSQCSRDEPHAAGACAGDRARTDRQTTRRKLRREVAGTVGLLTDEHDFRAMRRYRTFAFPDFATYLAAVEDLLNSRASQGAHTTVALFDPEEYADFCADAGLDPDSPTSRARFTAELATMGPALPYDGQPLADLIPALLDEAVRQATWEYASTLLARLGACTCCGEDIGRAAFARSSSLLARILDTARPGRRHLVCSVSAAREPLIAVLHADTGPDGVSQLDEAEAFEFTTILALGLATRSPGGLVMRTIAPSAPDRVYGWRLRKGDVEPLTAGEVFDAYCTDADSGDLVSPESGVDYCVPPDLGPDSAPLIHRH